MWIGLVLGALGGVLGSACGAESYVIDPFPVLVDFQVGVPRLQAELPEIAGFGVAEAVLDTGSPLTLVDGEPQARQRTSVDLIAKGVPRARWLAGIVLRTPLGGVGFDGGARVDAKVIVGADFLRQLDTRLDPAADRLFFFPNLAGDDDALGRACSAVFPVSQTGGGELVVGADTLSYPATRIVLGACINPDPPVAGGRPLGAGADVLLLLTTGLPMTVISETAYDRARKSTDPPAASLTQTEVLHMPGSPPGATVTVKLASLDAVALVAELGENRGPCAELLGSRMMDLGGCRAGERCHCGGATRACAAGASVERQGPLVVAVLSDADPALQGLRAELAPGLADVDGFLGMDLLAQQVTDLDYPGARVVIRCNASAETAGTCVARPNIKDQASVAAGGSLRSCVRKQAWAPTTP
jgi:hypothetical protein